MNLVKRTSLKTVLDHNTIDHLERFGHVLNFDGDCENCEHCFYYTSQYIDGIRKYEFISCSYRDDLDYEYYYYSNPPTCKQLIMKRALE